MQNCECPHCHERSIPAWRKLSLVEPNQGLLLWWKYPSLTCQNCGAKVKLRARSQLLGVVPFCVVAPLAPLFDSMTVYLGLLGASLALGMWLVLKMAPLIEINDTIEPNEKVDRTIDEYYNRY
jgi:hypothetical protein